MFARRPRGAAIAEATAAGVRAGFVTGGLISLAMIAASFLVRRPRELRSL
ncbi:hypothetical protein [Mangrovicoccus ximenensis]|nr:hypothetical protein [Mangrovicoccus ximenensis]